MPSIATLPSIKEVLIVRDGLTPPEAERLIFACKEDLNRRINNGELPFDICAIWFGLEDDYLFELLE